MAPATDSPKWYLSLPLLIFAAVLFPPAGLVMVWSRPATETGRKVFASLCIAVWGAVYAYFLFGSGGHLFTPGSSSDAHYAELERHREAQHKAGVDAPDPTSVSAQSSAATSPQDAVSSIAAPVEAKKRGAGIPSGAYWTSFRGPARDGHYDEFAVRTSWPVEGLARLWKQPIGGGYSSFVVASGIAYTIEQRRNQEVVAAYDVRNGRELWTRSWDGRFKESMGGDGPRATPTWDDGKLYALGAQGEFYCLNAQTGAVIWSKNILKSNGAENLQWGMAASPLIVDDKVIVLPGGKAGSSVVAYNKVNGSIVWRSLNDAAAYSSPMLVTLAGKRQILAITGDRVVGLEPNDGSLLWDYPWKTYQGIAATQPIVVDEHRIFISSGYGKGSTLLEVNDTQKGLAVHAVWENSSMKNKFNSSVLYQGHIYGLDEGILTCIDVGSGERNWKGGRYGYGQVTLASGNLIIISEEGELVLVKATPERHMELARFSAIEGKTWNCPAISGKLLLVRNETEMACFDMQ